MIRRDADGLVEPRPTPDSPHRQIFSEAGELQERPEGVVVPRASRRSFLASLALTTAATSVRVGAADPGVQVPIGLQMYSVRDEEKQDRLGTLEALQMMGYECVEFWSPYSSWTTAYAREVRRKLDGLGLKCHSNHTGAEDFAESKLSRIVELNQILGSRWVIMAHAGPQPDLDGWKKTAETLTRASTQLRPQGLKVGYHNWDVDFRPVGNVRPIDVLTGNTPSEVGFQLDVATCLAAGADPLAFIRANAGRIKSYHLKDCWGRGMGTGSNCCASRNRWVVWSTISSSRREVGSRPWRPRGDVW